MIYRLSAPFLFLTRSLELHMPWLLWAGLALALGLGALARACRRRRTTEDAYQASVKAAATHAFMFFRLTKESGTACLVEQWPSVRRGIAAASRLPEPAIRQHEGVPDEALATFDNFAAAYPNLPANSARYVGARHGVTLLDHARVGGEHFLVILAATLGGRPPQVPSRTATPFWRRLAAVLRFVACDAAPALRYSPRLPTTQRHLPLYRVRVTLPAPAAPSARAGAIRAAAAFLFATLDQPWDAAPLRAFLPVAFASEEDVFNNVGIVFVDLGANFGVEHYASQLKARAYQAVATNEMLHWNLRGSPRHSTDVVLTMGFSRDVPVSVAHDLAFSATFFHRPVYPIYMTAFTIGDRLHLSITSQCSAHAPLSRVRQRYPSAEEM
jgi:hypothetical protein